MKNAVENSNFDFDYYRELFIKVIKILKNMGDDNVFKNERNAFVPAYYEGITIGIAQNIEEYESNFQIIPERVEKLKKDEDFKKYSGSASNSKSRIRNRLKCANKIFSQQ